jgi:hypothetical protein
MSDKEKKWILPMVYANRRIHRDLIEVLMTVEEYKGYAVLYLWFHYPYDWSATIKPYDWEPVAIAFEDGRPARIFWRPHWRLRCARPVLVDRRTVVFYISPYKGNAPRCSHFDLLLSMLEDPSTYGIPYRRFRELPLKNRLKEGWPPEHEAHAESFRNYVHRGLEGIKRCGGVYSVVMGFFTDLLRAYLMARRRSLDGLYYYLRTAWGKANERFRRSGAGYEMYNLLIAVKYMLMFQRATGEGPTERFWRDMEGNSILPPTLRALTSHIWYPIGLLMTDGYAPAQPFKDFVDRKWRQWFRDALKARENKHVNTEA